ncbi:MAG: hypothetical protein ACREEM_29880 [Blastocatellia bacterium]
MSQSSIGSLNQAQVFQCLNCREMINVSLANCPYCGVAINPETAHAAADNQAIVAQACSNASYLKIMARAMVGFFLFSFVPFVGGIGSWGFLAMLVIIPIVMVRWWVKYRNLQTGDPDFDKARRDTIVALAIWSAMVVVWIVISMIQAFLMLRQQ